MAKERRSPIQVTEKQWLSIKAKWGLDNVSRDQFNTSLRDRRRVIRMSKALEKALDDSGMSPNDYRRLVRSTKEFALTEKAAVVFEKAAFGDEISVKKAQFFIGGFKKSLERMRDYDAEYVYVYKDGSVNYFKFDVDNHQVEVTWSGGKGGATITKTYDISEAKGLSTVLGMAKTKEMRKVSEEVGEILLDESEE